MTQQKKQTAVEWLYDQLPDHLRLSENGFDMLQKAKQMDREQMEISDDEIKKAAHEHGYEHHSFFTIATSNQKKLSWIAACKWYREQLKQKIK